MAKIEIRDVSRHYTTYSRADGSGEDNVWECYVVLYGGYEVYRSWSRIKAERYAARFMNTAARRRAA